MKSFAVSNGFSGLKGKTKQKKSLSSDDLLETLRFLKRSDAVNPVSFGRSQHHYSTASAMPGASQTDRYKRKDILSPPPGRNSGLPFCVRSLTIKVFAAAVSEMLSKTAAVMRNW